MDSRTAWGFNTKALYPVLMATRITGPTEIAFWCPWCLREHFHGVAGPGHRVAHCDGTSPFRETGYYLAAPPEIVKQIPVEFRAEWKANPSLRRLCRLQRTRALEAR